MSKVTNLSKATDLVKAAVDARTPKSDIIAQLMVELNISKANAFVYFTKATKATGVTITKGEGKAKAKAKTDDEKADEFFEKAAARMKAKEDKAKSKITELSSAKKSKKVAEIDAVVAAMQPQSPFAQLGV